MSKRQSLGMLLAVCLLLAPFVVSADTVVTLSVNQYNLEGWTLGWENTTERYGMTAFVEGPATPPMGNGSIYFESGSNYAREIAYTRAFAGNRLDAITFLEYATYRAEPASGVLAVALQFDIDLGDGYMRRLVYEPYNTPDTVVATGIWESWQPLDKYWWITGPVQEDGTGLSPAPDAYASPCGMSAPCPLSTILSQYPDTMIVGKTLFKMGGWWYPFKGNVDAFTITLNGMTTTYDFEHFTLQNLTDLCTLTHALVEDEEIASALCDKIAEPGGGKALNNKLGAFINQVKAQTGKAITQENAAILIDAAHTLMVP